MRLVRFPRGRCRRKTRVIGNGDLGFGRLREGPCLPNQGIGPGLCFSCLIKGQYNQLTSTNVDLMSTYTSKNLNEAG